MANNSSSVVVSQNKPDGCFLSVADFNPYDMNRPDSVHPTWTFLATINGLAAPPTIVVNALVIWTVIMDENLRSSAFNILLASLAVTDFLVGLLVEPLYCLFLGCLLNKCLSPECTFTVYILSSLACSGATMVSFTLASAERYLAIEHPNFYRKNITAKKVISTTAIIWVIFLACLISASALLNRTYPHLYKVPSAVAGSILGMIILYCSLKVQITAYRQSRTIALQKASVQQPNDEQEQEQRLKEYKRVFMMTILVIASVLFYTPYIIVSVIKATRGTDVTSNFQYVATPICATLIHLQSLINPIIMSLRLSYIRQGIKNKLASLV
ncbi:histamine H2 receptor [Exaiptasia diaphana]|uniref:G-protein coupled receptors family 1 profile domain-containing protein n=1 Tax=Exaiptasia diaphana TaxID=2652724 RepID=A0A913XV68_EXADI|nr:histamine H2 receptor [Exaiptasia diaphana]